MDDLYRGIYIVKIPCDAEPGQTWNFNELDSDEMENPDDERKAGLWVYYDYNVDAFEKAVAIKFKVVPEGGENPNMFFGIIFWLIIYIGWVIGVSAALYFMVL